jgi:extracellular factor (EF) 3-hydroxypalmitic acid methyl ester biosynthesis protein
MPSITEPNIASSHSVIRIGEEMLDSVQDLLVTGYHAEAVRSLVIGTKDLRDCSSVADWTNFATSIARQHPVRSLIHQDPFVLHSFTQPRGYAGDAELLDYIYGSHDTSNASDLGKAIYESTFEASACRSVRIRRRLLASTIDLLAMETSQPRILSVACGHLREAQTSIAVQEKMIGEFVALDQDRASLATVGQELNDFGINTVNASVRSILSGKTTFHDFDLVYSAGLYDYLASETAKRLTRVLFTMLKPGGKLLIANFSTDLDNVGYMESFMDWWLIYRSEAQVLEFANEIPPAEIFQQRLYRDRLKNVIYFELVRA